MLYKNKSPTPVPTAMTYARYLFRNTTLNATTNAVIKIMPGTSTTPETIKYAEISTGVCPLINWIRIASSPTAANSENVNTIVARYFESSNTLFVAGVDHTTDSIFTYRSRCIASPV